VTPPPCSLSPRDLPLLGDIFSRQAGRWSHFPLLSVVQAGKQGAPNGGRVIDWPTAAAMPCLGISCRAGDESYAGGDGNDLLTWGFAGPTILAACRSRHDHDGGAILVGL
jgi:hypothetical protein